MTPAFTITFPQTGDRDPETKLDCAEKGIPHLVSAIDFLDDVIPTADLLTLKRILRRAKQRQKLLRLELMG